MMVKSFAAVAALSLALALPLVPAFAGVGEGCPSGQGLCGQPALMAYVAGLGQQRLEAPEAANVSKTDPAVSDYARSLYQGVLAGG